MKLAVIADIHGNLPALEAVVGDLAREKPDRVVVAGDLVNRGPMNEEVVSFVVDRGWHVIEGNHDTLIADWMQGEVPEHWLSDPWYAPLEWVSDQLDGWFQYLRSLPFEARLQLDRAPAIRVVHASPRSTREGIHRHIADSDLELILGEAPETLVVCAHTHKPLDRRVGNRRVVNVGSVGVPFNGDPRAQYGIFTWSGRGSWNVELRRVEYDRAPVVHAFAASGYLSAGTAARIFLHEYRSARSHLYRFERWAESSGLPKDDDSWETFRAHKAP